MDASVGYARAGEPVNLRGAVEAALLVPGVAPRDRSVGMTMKRGLSTRDVDRAPVRDPRTGPDPATPDDLIQCDRMVRSGIVAAEAALSTGDSAAVPADGEFAMRILGARGADGVIVAGAGDTYLAGA